MTALIAYASNSGGTYLTAKLIRDSLKTSGTKVSLKKAKDVKVKDVEGADLVLIGSPSWFLDGKHGRPLETITELVEKLKAKDFSDKSFALFGCGDTSYLPFCGAVDVLEEFVKSVNGKRVTDSLKIDGFFFDLAGNTEKVESWAGSLTTKMPVSSIV